MSDLESRYLTLFGREQSKGQLYAGLYLLLGGFILGLVALGLFFYSGTRDGAALFHWREGALALGAVALTTFFLGVSVALPSKRGMRIAGFVGVALCLAAIVLFMLHYPLHFNVQDSADPDQSDYTALDTSLFAVGLAIIVAGAFVSVIGYYVSRITGSDYMEREVYEDEYGNPTYEVPDWVVEQDLEDAMARYGVDWGVSGDSAPSALQINVEDSFGPNTKVGGLGKPRQVLLSGPRIDSAVAALRSMRPEKRDKKELGDEGVDDAVAALRALKKAKQEDPKAYEPPKRRLWRRHGRRAGSEGDERDGKDEDRVLVRRKKVIERRGSKHSEEILGKDSGR